MFAAGFAAGSRVGGGVASPAAETAAEGLPGAEELRRLAVRALRDATGRKMRVGPVEVGERLADGSFMVVLTLEDGRRISGRLFRDRMRFRIAADRRELFSPETTVRIKTQ